MNTVLSAGICGLLLAAPAIGQVPEVQSAVAMVEPAPPVAGASSTVRTYEVRMFRPERVGQRTHVKCFGMQEQSTSMEIAQGSQPMQAGLLSVDFDAEAEVKRVDRRGRASEVVYTVRRCTVTRDGMSSDPFRSGAKITARADRTGRKTEFRVDGQPLDSSLVTPMTMVAGLDHEELTEDEVLGTDRPRAVGESWAIDRKLMAQVLKNEANTDVVPEHISGVTTLADTVEHAGQDCLVLQTNVVTENTVPGLDDLPAGFDLTDGDMTLTFQYVVPKDHRLPAVSNVSRMEARFVLTNSSNASSPVKMVCRFVQSVEREMMMLSRTTAAESNGESEME
jgi:hypothetical protein